MVKIITATEAMVIDRALKDAYKNLIDFGAEDSDLEDLKDARAILKKLKETTIEEVLGV